MCLETLYFPLSRVLWCVLTRRWPLAWKTESLFMYKKEIQVTLLAQGHNARKEI
jgi:hypothetical protein